MPTTQADTPADIVIERFGGIRKLARLLGVHAPTVYRWRAPREKGGTGGRIPAKYQARLLALAKKRRVRLSASDLIDV